MVTSAGDPIASIIGVLPINEIFTSIQGEGTLVGTPSTFIRVVGCNLRCAWCDSPTTSWEPKGKAVPIENLLGRCEAGPRHVVLTGGEPMLFPGCSRLARALRAGGHHITVETAGTVWQDAMECDLLSLSPKLAHSTPWTRNPRWALRHEARRIDVDRLRRLCAHFEWQLKLVVRSHDPEELAMDLEEVDGLVASLSIPDALRSRVLLMPEGVDAAQLREAYGLLLPHCTQRGFALGRRLHIELFGHRPGT